MANRLYVTYEIAGLLCGCDDALIRRQVNAGVMLSVRGTVPIEELEGWACRPIEDEEIEYVRQLLKVKRHLRAYRIKHNIQEASERI